MTYKDTERWLSRGRFLKYEIKLLDKRINEANERATSTTSSPDAIVVQGTKDPHKFDKLAELTSTLWDHRKRLDCILSEIQKAINKLDDPKQRIVLSRYYVDSARAETIALELNDCSYQYIYKIKKQGIKTLKNMM